MNQTPVRAPRLDDLTRLAVPTHPALSPDGATVVYAVTTADREADQQRSALWRVPAGGGPAAPLTRGPADSAPAWSPDGSRIAFLRGGDGPPQVWLLPAGIGEPTRLTDLPGGAGAPVWSPDGARIAFTAPVGTTPVGSAAGDGEPVVADRLGYKTDGVGLWRGRRRHVFVVDLATGSTEQLTRGDWHAGAPAWSPDGTRLAFAAGTAPDADLTGESAAYLVDLAGTTREVWHGVAGSVGWTPDGDALVVVGRPEPRPGHERLLRVPAGGGPAQPLAAGLDRNVMPGRPGYPGGLPQFDQQTLLFCARDRGCTHLYAVSGDTVRKVLGGADRVVSGLSVAAGRAAVTVATAGSYGEVVVVDLAGGTETTVTDHALPDVELLRPREREFRISDDTTVHGWLLRDPAAPTPAPLLLDIHGGPHNAWNPAPGPGKLYHQLLAARGWAVLLLNPRASDGYGEAFYTAAVGGWGGTDERDFLEPVDALVAEGIADPDRLAVTGYSYGGYMTCWLTGRTDRFAAAVPGGPVTDLTSLAGTSDAGHWLTGQENGALPYQDPERIAAQSPYPRVGQVRTPTLILQGAADDRCPPGQAEQWFAALRGRGVPARLVLYPEASHLFLAEGRPSHRADYSRRLVEWVTRHTRTAGATDRDRDRWQQRLAELAQRYRVPGAVLGIDHAGQRVELAAGVTNVDTGVPVTPDTLFQIGSITKLLTATAVLRLVEAGRLDLDRPVAGYLPELALSDPEVRERVTVRHLLTHTSGIDGDVFRDTGRGDDCLARYVAGLADVPQNHPLGATFSYCNTGFSIAGRVIEVLTGQVWDAAMRELLFDPLGLAHTATLPEEALLHRTAVGHVHEADEPPRRTPVWVLPRSGAPAGGTPAARAGDLLTFARLFLAGGRTAGGDRLLSADTVAQMQAEQVRLPERVAPADSWGLGWCRWDWHGTRLFGHDGATIGQRGFLRVLPEHDLTAVLLSNGGFAPDLYQELVREVVRELTGVEMADPVSPPTQPPPADVTPHAGAYQRFGMRYDVWQADRPRLRATSQQEVAGLDRPPKEFPLVPMPDGGFVLRPDGARTWEPVNFYRLADGTPYLHHGLRATPKTG